VTRTLLKNAFFMIVTSCVLYLGLYLYGAFDNEDGRTSAFGSLFGDQNGTTDSAIGRVQTHLCLANCRTTEEACNLNAHSQGQSAVYLQRCNAERGQCENNCDTEIEESHLSLQAPGFTIECIHSCSTDAYSCRTNAFNQQERETCNQNEGVCEQNCRVVATPTGN
jgi:hypothetical protein